MSPKPGTSDSPYRDDVLGPVSRRRELQQAYRREIEDLPARLARVYGRRLARLGFGVAAVIGGTLMFMVAVIHYEGGFMSMSGSSGQATRVLGLTWMTALAIYLLVRPLATRGARAALRRLAEASSDVHTDIARLQNLRPGHYLVRLADRWEWASIAWPLMGIALIGPLTMHWLVGMVVSELQMTAAEYDIWIQASLFLVGHCHLVVAVLGARFATEVRALPKNAEVLPNTRWRRFFWVIAVSVFPGGILILPVVIVAITAGVYAFLVYGWIARCIEHERQTLLDHVAVIGGPGRGDVVMDPAS